MSESFWSQESNILARDKTLSRIELRFFSVVELGNWTIVSHNSCVDLASGSHDGIAIGIEEVVHIWKSNEINYRFSVIVIASLRSNPENFVIFNVM